MRIMALDFGDARTGVAISDAGGLLTGRTCVIHQWDPERAAQEAAKLAAECGAEELVVGFPRNMDGSEGARAERYRAFAARMEELTGLPVVLWDERRTTIDAHNILQRNGQNAKKRKKTVDAVAAALMLEGYLTRRRLEGGR